MPIVAFRRLYGEAEDPLDLAIRLRVVRLLCIALEMEAIDFCESPSVIFIVMLALNTVCPDPLYL